MALQGTFYHIGIIVPDVDAAAAHLSDLLGVSWGPLTDAGEVAIRDADGDDLRVPLRVLHSTEPPHIELIQEVPGSIWVCNEHSNLHHIGLWTDGLVSESDRLGGLRCPLQLAGIEGDEAPKMWAYHRDELGILVEIVDVSLKPMMEQSVFTDAAT